MHYCLTDFVLEIVHNAYAAQAKKIKVTIVENTVFSVIVGDNGVGMTPAQVEQALDPFYTEPGKHHKRRVGLGLPFVKQITEMTGGKFALDSTVGHGTTVAFSVPLQHIDCPPLGDLVDGLVSLLTYTESAELIINREKNGQRYQLTRTELGEALGGFETAIEVKLLREYIQSQEQEI